MDKVRSAHFKKLSQFAEDQLNQSGESSNNEENHHLNHGLPPIFQWKEIIKGLIQPKHRQPDFSLVLVELWKKFAEEETELDIPDAPNFQAIYKFIEDLMS